MKARDPFIQDQETEHERDLRTLRSQRMQQLLNDLMQDENGREFVWHLLDFSGVNASIFNTNALTMAFAEGRRSYGLDLQRLIAPDFYHLMLREEHARRTKRKRH